MLKLTCPDKIARRQRLDAVCWKPRRRSSRAGQQEHDTGELPIDALVRPEIPIAKIEEGLPVDKPSGCAFSATKIGRIRVIRILAVVEDERKERIVPSIRTTKVQSIAGTNLRMSESIGSDRKFYRYLGWTALLENIESKALLHDIVETFLSDGLRQELVHDNPLIVPTHLASGLRKYLLRESLAWAGSARMRSVTAL